jgi:predicted site-specific integrase-resolvase
MATRKKFFNVDAAAPRVPCAANTLRKYIRTGALRVNTTTSGHAVLTDADIERARAIKTRNLGTRNAR